MTHTDLLVDAFGRVEHGVHAVLDGASDEVLTYRADPDANTIAWLVWHIARVQDAQLAPLAGRDESWSSNGWYDRFEVPFDASASGYGQSSADVAAITADADLLRGYFDDVQRSTVEYVRSLTDADLERVVDTNWNPPVTLGVRLISTVADDLQHVGQAAYVKGLATRAGV
ncbi:DinB family protein [Microbacterium sp. STN6]|uniref:mycothiol transferase n=1 Tax=Microbacterium sp. STN6 TaxID=2995588 RepID=UPI002260E999|nr:DinB family protein [Microbacterium sp. STN6]MCX7520818.1 DinB family protein [Microbacterium sp. STN6]